MDLMLLHLVTVYPAPNWRTPGPEVDAELLAYSELDVRITDGFMRQLTWYNRIARKARRAERRFEEDGILPVALHDDSQAWELR